MNPQDIQIGQTISADQFKSMMPTVGQTIPAEQFKQLQQQDSSNQGVGAFSMQNLFNPQPQNNSILGMITRGLVSPLRALGLPGAVVSDYMTKGAQEGMDQSQLNLRNVNDALLKKIATMQDGPQKQNLMGIVRENMKVMGMGAQQQNDLANAQVTPMQAAGTGVQGALTAATLGTNPTAIAANVLGKTGLLDALSVGSKAFTAARIAGTMGVNALEGAGFGASSALENGMNSGDATNSVLTGAIGGAVLPELTSYVGNKAVQGLKGVAAKFIDNAFPAQSSKIAQKEVSNIFAGQEEKNLPAKFLDYQGKYPKMFTSNYDAGSTIEQKILPDIYQQWNKLAQGPVGGQRIKIGDLIAPIKDSFSKLADYLPSYAGKDPSVMTSNDFQTILDSATNKTISWRNALTLRKAVDKVIPKNLWTSVDPKINAAVGDLLRIRGTLADRLSEAAQGTGYDELNKAYGMYKTILQRIIYQEAKPSLGFTEKIAGTGAIGSLMSGHPEVGIPLLTGIALEKAARSLPVKLGTGLALNKASQLGSSVLGNSMPAQVGQRLTKTALFKLLTNASNQSQ